MKASEAQQLMEFLHAAFPRLEVEQIQLYSRLLEREDNVDAASKAILKGIDEWRFPPSWAEMKEWIRMEKRLSEPDDLYTVPVNTSREMPAWVKRWVCARYLYARFGREKDMRPFREQHGYIDPTVEVMPEDEWLAESEMIDLGQAWKAILYGTR